LRTKLKKITLALLALASTTSLYAQVADPDSADKLRPTPQLPQSQAKQSFWDRLELTDDQKDKLKQIREADRDNLRAAWAQVKIAQESLHAALLANPEDTADIQAKATNLADALRTKSVQWALHEARVSQVLTPTQRVTLYEAIKNHMNGVHRHERWSESGHWQERHSEKRNQSERPAAPAPSASAAPEAPTN
jgi:Spy/CpxP family protein refolding chaperone